MTQIEAHIEGLPCDVNARPDVLTVSSVADVRDGRVFFYLEDAGGQQCGVWLSASAARKVVQTVVQILGSKQG